MGPGGAWGHRRKGDPEAATHGPSVLHAHIRVGAGPIEPRSHSRKTDHMMAYTHTRKSDYPKK
jgi:hypothetical protein